MTDKPVAEMAFEEAMAALEGVVTQAQALQRELLEQLAQQTDERANWPAAAQTVRALMFLDKLATEVERKRATLD